MNTHTDTHRHKTKPCSLGDRSGLLPSRLRSIIICAVLQLCSFAIVQFFPVLEMILPACVASARPETRPQAIACIGPRCACTYSSAEHMVEGDGAHGGAQEAAGVSTTTPPCAPRHMRTSKLNCLIKGVAEHITKPPPYGSL